VLTKKQGSLDGDIVHYKAISVAKDYTQRECIDYNEIFLPVVKHLSIQILLTLAAQYKLELDQIYVKIAFLHGDLDEGILVSHPTRFKTRGKENMVCKLKKITL